MTVTIIRVKRFSDSIATDLRRLGFKQINVISFCYGDAMAVAHGNLGTRDSTDLIVSNEMDASLLIGIFQRNGIYISHRVADNKANDDFILSERGKCALVK